MSSDFIGIADWLVGNASSHSDLRVLTEQFVSRLNASSMQIERLNLGVMAVHPEMAGYAVMWEPGMEQCIEVPVRHEDLQKPTYRLSPIRFVVEQRRSVAFDLTDTENGSEYPVLDEFRAKGFTHYVGFPIPYGEDGIAILTMCTRRESGFYPEHLAGIETVFPVLSLLINVVETRRLARTILRTYLGKDTGERVLAGDIVRGGGERIEAAVWFCDLRNYTVMTSELGSFAMIDVMNDYFDCMAEAIWAEGGEILKFMGDAILAVFRIGGDRAKPEAARAAVRAAQAAVASLAAVSDNRVAAGDLPLAAGVSVHLGSVVYGNIGAKSRLDFTVMGHSVNLVARIQGLNGSLGEAILFSSEVADHVAAQSVGLYPLKGVREPVAVFKPQETT